MHASERRPGVSRKHAIIGFLICLLGAAAVTALTTWVVKMNDVPRMEGLSETFVQGLQEPLGTRFIATEMASFPWDQLCILGSVRDLEWAENLMGVSWPYWLIPQMRESPRNFVFTRGDSVVAVFHSEETSPVITSDFRVCLQPEGLVFEVQDMPLLDGETMRYYRIRTGTS